MKDKLELNTIIVRVLGLILFAVAGIGLIILTSFDVGDDWWIYLLAISVCLALFFPICFKHFRMENTLRIKKYLNNAQNVTKFNHYLEQIVDKSLFKIAKENGFKVFVVAFKSEPPYVALSKTSGKNILSIQLNENDIKYYNGAKAKQNKVWKSVEYHEIEPNNVLNLFEYAKKIN